MSRVDTPGRERDRYRRASLREQLGGELAELRRHPGVMAAIVLIVGGWLVLTITQPAVVQVDRLAVGDCLYIHAPDADTTTPTGRPAGTAPGAVMALYGQGAERAGCGGSHSHEVAATFVFPDAAGAAYPGIATLEDSQRAACDATFTAWVGRAPDGSELEAVLAVPDEAGWSTGVRSGACLVAHANGQFLGGPAKGSGR
jgi:hypothetical protein